MTSAAATSARLARHAWADAGGVRSAIARVGIVGLDATGAELAGHCLQAGLETVGCETSAVVAQHVRDEIERALYWSDGVRPASRFTLTAGLSELADCDLVIDCVDDRGPRKRELVIELDATLPEDARCATLVSRISVTELAAGAERPGRVVGLHLPTQAGEPRLVEVVRGELTDPDAADAVASLMKRIGLQPVRCEDTPGLLVDRVLVPLLNDCVRLLDEAGVTPESLDAGLRASTGWTLGPCALLDSIGIDTHMASAESLYAALREPRFAPPPRLVRMRRAGLLGRKTGKGFYSY
jgi:3-hydroxybutyryl-CoA dehydrogenase